jgi:hypothetical protein
LLSAYADTFSIPTSVASVPTIDAWHVTPNPASDFISISGTEGATAQLQLFDLNGKLILSQTVTTGQQVPVASLPAGVYLCILENESAHQFSRKITITH